MSDPLRPDDETTEHSTGSESWTPPPEDPAVSAGSGDPSTPAWEAPASVDAPAEPETPAPVEPAAPAWNEPAAPVEPAAPAWNELPAPVEPTYQQPTYQQPAYEAPPVAPLPPPVAQQPDVASADTTYQPAYAPPSYTPPEGTQPTYQQPVYQQPQYQQPQYQQPGYQQPQYQQPGAYPPGYQYPQGYQQPYPQQWVAPPDSRYGSNFVVILGALWLFLIGILVTLSGIVMLAARTVIDEVIDQAVIEVPRAREFADQIRDAFFIVAIALVIIGVVHLLSAIFIWAHRNWARFIGILLTLLGLIGAAPLVYISIAPQTVGDQVITGSIVVNGIPFALYLITLLALLFGGGHFRKRPVQ